MNILVIGNGFDLAHELPTKYTDFLEFIRQLQKERREEKISDDFVVDCFENFLEKKNLWADTMDSGVNKEDVFKYVENINNFSDPQKRNFWMQHFFYKQNEMGGRWVDFEQEISDCVKIIETTPDNIFVNFYNTSEEIQKYILTMEKRDVIKKLEKDLDNLNKSVELYMLLINKSRIFVPTIKAFAGIPEPQYIINFNYTTTYNECWNDDVINNVDFIHGKAGNGNVILGAGETLTGDTINTELSCVRFKKYFQRIYNRTGGKYRQWFKDEEQKNINRTPKMNDIIIYGHSLDITDKDILSYIILHKLTAKVTIYYYKDDKKSDYETSIINLIQVIGKEELTARVGDGRIEFISTEDMGGKSVKAIV